MLTTFEINPQPKPRMTQSDKWNSRPATANYWEYKARLQNAAKKAELKIGDTIDVTFYITMPNSWNKRKRLALLGKPHTGKPDIDNLVKGFMDALLEDDSRVWYIVAKKFWSLSGKVVVYAPNEDIKAKLSTNYIKPSQDEAVESPTTHVLS